MSVEEIFLVRFDFIEYSYIPEFEGVLTDLVNTEIDLSASVNESNTEYSEVSQWEKTEQSENEPHDKIEFYIYSYHDHLLVQTRLDLSERTLQQWLPESDRAIPHNQPSDEFREYAQVVSKLDQICSEYPSLVNQVPVENSPTVLHCAITNPPEMDSAEEWIEKNILSLRELGFTQTSGLQSIVDGTYLVSLHSFPNYSSDIIAINIFASIHDKHTLSIDAKNFFKYISQHHLAHYFLRKHRCLIESKSALSFNIDDIVGQENLDELIQMESKLIDNMGWYDDIRSTLKPHNPVLNIESSINETTVLRNENADLAETTYFDHYQQELSDDIQALINSIKDTRHQNERLLNLTRDRISAIGTQKNVKLQKLIFYLTIVTAAAAVISLIIAFSDTIQFSIDQWLSRI